MLKKILQKLGFFKKNDDELNEGKSKTKENLEKKEEKKDNKNSNTPDDIYPLW